MPLVDVLAEKWRQWRVEVARGEESRKKVFRQLHDDARHEDCQKVAYHLWETNGKPEGNRDRYYEEAQKQLQGFRWRLYQLHQPFISLEKHVIEPLDRWSDRANIFQFFSKLSPIIEAIGVLAIPFVILIFEFRQENRQQQFEERVISAQADVRQQQAVREYLSQVTTIHLESDQGEKLRGDEELQKLLAANTLALFNELSLREDSRKDANDDTELDLEALKSDRKGQVIEFLSGLGWINGLEEKKPLLSLSGVDLSNSNLERANLWEADLSNSNLERANLWEADLSNSNLEGANLLGAVSLNRAYLSHANLEGVNLEGANLEGVELFGANLFRVNLERANLERANLAFTNLLGANLKQANLFGVKMERANLKGANLEGANLEGTYMFEVIFCNTTMPDGSINKQDCPK